MVSTTNAPIALPKTYALTVDDVKHLSAQPGAKQAALLVGLKVTELPCKHIFNAAELEQWFEEEDACPTCGEIVPGEEYTDEYYERRERLTFLIDLQKQKLRELQAKHGGELGQHTKTLARLGRNIRILECAAVVSFVIAVTATYLCVQKSY